MPELKRRIEQDTGEERAKAEGEFAELESQIAD
jgi:hypothetical protein